MDFAGQPGRRGEGAGKEAHDIKKLTAWGWYTHGKDMATPSSLTAHFESTQNAQLQSHACMRFLGHCKSSELLARTRLACLLLPTFSSPHLGVALDRGKSSHHCETMADTRACLVSSHRLLCAKHSFATSRFVAIA